MKSLFVSLVLVFCSSLLAVHAQELQPDSTAQPVELLHFHATSSTQGINLEWATAAEKNFSHYLIERSENGRDFYELHKLVAESPESSTTRTYKYTDKSPGYGANYYRLTSYDLDNTFEQKGIVLAYSGTKGELQVIKQGDYLTIRYPGADAQSWLLISNMNGQEVMRIRLPERDLTLHNSSLPRGLFFVKVYNQYEVRKAKILMR